VDAADDRAGRGRAEEDPMRLEEDVATALRRAAIYRVLATAFTYPTPARLDWLAAAATAAADATPDRLAGPLARLAEAARGEDTARLAGEHVRLFERQVQCPPYEGAYGPPQMAGKAALVADVAGFYRAFGLEPGGGQPEIEDHLGAELEFMSALAVKEAWALAQQHGEGLDVTSRAQRSFLAEHLARWSATFAERIAATGQGFHAAAAALLTAWLDAECERLGVAVVPLEGVREAEEAPFACPMAPGEPEGPGA
jgi:DMSO reductase family type II enzyme chaperone